MRTERVRNFCIIAHIDHGKSTLADRLIEHTKAIPSQKMKEQVLDDMDLERERGITIKARAVRLEYQALDGKSYTLNLIDTPGHVDFSYEVSRSLAACEGALLVVDAVQGVEAQTIAHAQLAMDNGLEIVPVINKIDLPNARIEEVKSQIEEVTAISMDEQNALLCSAKEGRGIQEVLEAIVHRLPPPSGKPEEPLKALVFDALYNPYRGVITYIRLFEGTMRPDMKIQFMASGTVHEIAECGVFKPKATPQSHLSAGDVGYCIANIKSITEALVGDTITEAQRPTPVSMPGYKELTPMVFCGLYPQRGDQYHELRDALEKLNLNDSSFVFEPESSNALGFGFRCGFLGLLHMEVVQERLEREFDLSLLRTTPSVAYKVHTLHGQVLVIDNPASLPSQREIASFEEPYIEAHILAPMEFLGGIYELCENRRGQFIKVQYMDQGKRALISYYLPLSETIGDFYDRLKSITRGYGSMDYDHAGYRQADLARVDILVNGMPVDALSYLVHREKAYYHGRQLCERLKELIPRQLFEVIIQASIFGKIIARQSVKPLRKNVTAKCYGGDITRKRKLLEKQKEGKKRLKQVGQVQIPQEAFMALLHVEK